MSGERYCTRCGSALNALSNCPMGCPAPAPYDPDDFDDEPEWEPDEDDEAWKP